MFPDSLSASAPRNAPAPHTVPLLNKSAVKVLPSTLNPLSLISQDSSLAFAIPYADAPTFLSNVRELPNAPTDSDPSLGLEELEISPRGGETRWVMKAAQRVDGVARRNFRQWADDVISEFLDLLKVSRLRRRLTMGPLDTPDRALY